jgi:ketosteroid isomerase-like protein
MDATTTAFQAVPYRLHVARAGMADSDILALNQLAYRYAAAVDDGDAEAFVAVFTPDARLRSYHPDAEEPFADLTGHAQLASIPKTMREMFRRTAHVMTNHLVEVTGDTATGALLCTARHLRIDPTDTEVWLVLIRYVDRYERRSGAWRIADRRIHFLWSERHQAVDSGVGRNGGGAR